MIRDIEAGDQALDAAIEWGVDFGLEEGEELPEDHEELTEAQYTVCQMMQTLKGVFEEAGVGEIRGEAPSGLMVPG
jgi:hypothetical protein